MVIGIDKNGKEIKLKDRLLRSDGIKGWFNLIDFELRFDYEEEQEDGAICSYINHGYSYEKIN